MSVTDKTETESKDRFLLNPYTDWTKAQGIPVYEGFGVDMLACETKPWDFTEANGALVHLKGRGDYVSVFVHDLPPGGKTRPDRAHLRVGPQGAVFGAAEHPLSAVQRLG
jgi:hypothetical protein